MERRPLGRSGLETSVLALGTMNFGADWHGVGALGEAEARALVDIALEAGVNHFDTADIYGYGASESLLGKALGARRRNVLIASKVCGVMRPGDPSSGGLGRKHIIQGVEDSLRRLGTEYLDLYMPHAPDPKIPAEESLEAFAELSRSGKVRALGVSNFSGEELSSWQSLGRSRGWPRLEFDQVQYSLAARFVEAGLVPVCLSEGVSVSAWSPLGGGFLTGKYRAGRPRPRGTRRSKTDKAFPALPEQRLEPLLKVLERVAELAGKTPSQTALAWVLSKPTVACAVIGARTPAQLRENLGAGSLKDKAVSWLDRAGRLLGV